MGDSIPKVLFVGGPLHGKVTSMDAAETLIASYASQTVNVDGMEAELKIHGSIHPLRQLEPVMHALVKFLEQGEDDEQVPQLPPRSVEEGGQESPSASG